MAVSRQVDLLEPINLAEHLDKVELYLGQVCQIAGISKMQLDYWTNKAQIPTKGKKQRIYDIDALETVMLIKQAKDKGLNLGAAIEAARSFREQHPDAALRLSGSCAAAATRRSGARARAGSRRAAAPAATRGRSRCRSDVGGLGVSAGSSSSVWLTLTPIPSTTRPTLASARMPATFLPSMSTSFGWLSSAGTPVSAAQRRRDGVAGDERELRPERHRRARVEEDREEERPPRRCLPRPPEPAPAVRLEVGRHRRPLGLVRVEQALGRLALLDEAVRAPEPSLQQRLDRGGGEIRHPHLD